MHKWKDEPAKWLKWKHRVERHGILDDLMLAVITGDPNVFVVGLIHDIQDMISSTLKGAEWYEWKTPRKKKRKRRNRSYSYY